MSRLDVRDAINGAADWAGGAPIVRKVVGNPFSAALLLTAMIGIVIMAVFHYKLSNDNWRTCARASFYIYALTTLLLFLHYSLVSREAHADAVVGGVRGVVSDIVGSRGAPAHEGYVPVVPGIKGGASYGWPPAASELEPPLMPGSYTLAQEKKITGGAPPVADNFDYQPVEVHRINPLRS